MLALPIGLAFLLLYFASAPAHTTMEDASEFTLMSHFLGLPHPPGYPLFVLLSHPFSWLSFLSPALRIAFFTMLAIIGSGYFTGLSILLLGGGVAAAGLSFALFCASSIPWAQALVVEVYPLHALVMTILLFLSLRLRIRASRKSVIVWFFFCGLALTNHWPLTILSLFGLLFLLWPEKRKLAPFITAAIPGFLVGLSPYIWLYAVNDKDLSFIGPISSMSDFINYVGRSAYEGRNLPFEVAWKEAILYMGDFFSLLLSNMYGLSAVLGILGTISLVMKRDWRLLLGLTLSLMSANILLLPLWRQEHTIYFRDIYNSFQIYPFVIGTILAGLGIQSSLRYFTSDRAKRVFLSSLALLMIPVIALQMKSLDLSKDDLAGKYAHLILSSLPENSVLIANDDADMGPLAYQHLLLKERPDIEILSQGGFLFAKKMFLRSRDIPNGRINSLIQASIESILQSGRRVFTIDEILSFRERNEDFPFRLTPYDWFLEITKFGDPQPLDSEELSGKTIQFLDDARKYSKSDQFPYMRFELIQYGCSFMIRHGLDHPALTQFPNCQYLLAEQLVSVGNLVSAEIHLREALEKRKGWPRVENLQIANRLLDVRMEMLGSSIDKNKQIELLNETFALLRPYAYDFPYCSNTVARRLVQIGDRELIPIFEKCFKKSAPGP